jgi:copper(I)-binding protein
MGVDADVGPVLLRAVHVEPPVSYRYPAGADAIVRLTLFDLGDRHDALIAVSTPSARRVDIHWDRDCDGDAERVRRLPLRPTNAGQLTPVPAAGPFDRYHLRVVELRQPVLAGTTVPLTFTFERAGRLDTAALVLPSDAPMPEPSRVCTGWRRETNRD